MGGLLTASVFFQAKQALEREQAKKKPDSKKLVAYEAQVVDMEALFGERVQHSGLLVKKGGKTGQKGQAERWFCLEEISPGVWCMEYCE